MKYEGDSIQEDGIRKSWDWLNVGNDFHSELYVLKNVTSITEEKACNYENITSEMVLKGYAGVNVYNQKSVELDFSHFSNAKIIGMSSLWETAQEEIFDISGDKTIVEGIKDGNPKEQHTFLICVYKNAMDIFCYLIIIDREAYLMNDDGKTIEKLVSLR